jgi:outer membrane protein OmpA-like peptidoglycan-associated protein
VTAARHCGRARLRGSARGSRLRACSVAATVAGVTLLLATDAMGARAADAPARSGDVAAGAVSPELRFVACPIYRDTDAGIKSGCWLADDPQTGLRYDVSLSPTKPDWNREVLVEGRATAEPSGACGGIVLRPARVSVLPGACTRAMLPAEGLPGRAFVLPARNVRPLSEPRRAPDPPYVDRSFHVPFDFDRSFVVYQLGDFLLDEAVTWTLAVKPARVRVIGHAATTPALVSGRMLMERPAVARERAERIAETLRRMGVPADRISTEWRDGSSPLGFAGADGLTEPSRRRADIVVDVD